MLLAQVASVGDNWLRAACRVQEIYAIKRQKKSQQDSVPEFVFGQLSTEQGRIARARLERQGFSHVPRLQRGCTNRYVVILGK